MGRRQQYRGRWEPIETAPLDEDVLLLVADNIGEYELPWPCKLTANGWVSQMGGPLAVEPICWRVMHARSPTRQEGHVS
jgi:hypothetical protein